MQLYVIPTGTHQVVLCALMANVLVVGYCDIHAMAWSA